MDKKKILVYVFGSSIGTYVFSFPFRFLENWLMGIIQEQLQQNWQTVLAFVITWILPLLVSVGLIYLGYRLREARFVGTKSYIPKTTETQIKSMNGHDLKIEVQRGIYQRRDQFNLLSKGLTLKTIIDPNPMLRIIVTAKFIPIGTVPIQSLELHSNGQAFKCINLPSPVFDHEDTYTLGFEAFLMDVKPALGKGGSPSFIRVITPIKDVTSNSFVLESAQ